MQTTSSRSAPGPVESLEGLFRGESIWCDAAGYLDERAESDVHFTSHPGSVWHLVRLRGETRLLPGPSSDPDFVFRFRPESVESLGHVESDLGDLAVRLFRLILEGEIDFRIVAPFPRLVRHGYLSLLAAGGLRVLAFGAAHGIRSVRDLRGLIEELRGRGEAEWETLTNPGKRVHRDANGLRSRIRRVAGSIAAQHDQLRAMVQELRGALAIGDREQLGRIARRYRDALEAHFGLEEEVVFPALHGLDPGLRPDLEQLVEDHARLFAAVRDLAAPSETLGDVEWNARFLELRRGLSLHESREEALMNAASRTARG